MTRLIWETDDTAHSDVVRVEFHFHDADAGKMYEILKRFLFTMGYTTDTIKTILGITEDDAEVL